MNKDNTLHYTHLCEEGGGAATMTLEGERSWPNGVLRNQVVKGLPRCTACGREYRWNGRDDK